MKRIALLLLMGLQIPLAQANLIDCVRTLGASVVGSIIPLCLAPVPADHHRSYSQHPDDIGGTVFAMAIMSPLLSGLLNKCINATHMPVTKAALTSTCINTVFLSLFIYYKRNDLHTNIPIPAIAITLPLLHMPMVALVSFLDKNKEKALETEKHASEKPVYTSNAV